MQNLFTRDPEKDARIQKLLDDLATIMSCLDEFEDEPAIKISVIHRAISKVLEWNVDWDIFAET